MKYRLSEIASICAGELVGADNAEGLRVTSVFTDSRNFSVGEGSLFVAICGRNHDGHDYIGMVYRRGVRAFLVEHDVDMDGYPGAGFVRVADAVTALQALGADWRSKFEGVVVAVTGSNGKTVVKEWIADIAPREVKIFRSPKSYNSQIGVPLSLLMIDGSEQVAVIEVGISQRGEMERLERVVRPNIGVITTIGDAHQENFSTIAEKLAQKLDLFEHVDVIVYNSSYSEIEQQLKQRFPKTKLMDAAGQKEVCGKFDDRASCENAAMALTICDVLGYNHAQGVERLSELHPVAMRLELKEGLNNSAIVNDSYNSDINSLEIALDYLQNVAGGRAQTLILSDILQSGFTQEELYGRVAKLVARSQIDRLVGIGERISRYGSLFEGINVEFFPTKDAFLGSLRREDIADRAILIKGNRSSQFEQLSHALERKTHTTTLEIDLDAMIHNLNVHRQRLMPATKTMAMVKASSYGHGTYEVASVLQHQGVDFLAVAFADEGVVLREGGITMPIVVLNADSDSFDLMISNSLEPEIYNFSSLAHFAAAAQRHGERNYPMHIKLDTGMHRLGFEFSDLERLNDELDRYKGLVRVSSIFSHFAASDEAIHDDFTRSQQELFDRFSSAITARLGYTVLRHIANSAAIERMPESEFDMVRLGVGLYGVGASPNYDVRQVGTLRSRIVSIKELDPPETVGYGRGGELTRRSLIATIPIGYADGLNRHLGGGRWSMMIGSESARTIGRICMDTCMIDVTGLDVEEGDLVTILGGGEGNSIEDMARVLDTIPYEIMTSVSARVKRIYIKE